MQSIDFTGLATLLSLLLTVIVVPLFRILRERYKNRYKSCVIGLVAGTPLPDALKPLPDYTSLQKARADGGTCILHCRTLSYALIHCDFVCANEGTDPKIHGSDYDWNGLIN
jgi:hypothetical protein